MYILGDLSGADLSRAILYDLDLSGADLSGVDLNAATMFKNIKICKTIMPWGEDNSGC